MGYTLSLIEAIKRGNAGISIDRLIEHARLNKVLLHFLRRLDIQGDIREREEHRYRVFKESLMELNNILCGSGYEYAFFKLYKPIEYVPADIDILVSDRDATRVAKELLRRGFSLEVLEPYTVTLIRGRLIVDLYTYPSLGNIAYLDGQRLLEYRTWVDLDGVEIVSLETPAEAVVNVAHSIAKEWIYTLNDYYTVSRWLDSRALDLCRELGCIYEAGYALTINRMIEEGIIETPFKIPNIFRLRLWGMKFIENPLTRGTSIKSISRLSDRRFGKLILSRLTRGTY